MNFILKTNLTNSFPNFLITSFLISSKFKLYLKLKMKSLFKTVSHNFVKSFQELSKELSIIFLIHINLIDLIIILYISVIPKTPLSIIPHLLLLLGWVMVFHATFNTISVISVLVVEETGVPRENHRPADKCCIEYAFPWAEFKLTTLVVIGTGCTGSCKSNYHTITITKAPFFFGGL